MKYKDTRELFKIMPRLAILMGCVFLSHSALAQSMSQNTSPNTAPNTVHDPRAMPEIATGLYPQSTAQGQTYMVVTPHKEATKAAVDILEQGGTAADAGIAAQLVLGLVEPQSSGLGGGAYALYYEADGQKLHSFDARETAPSAARASFFHDENGMKMDFETASLGGLPVGVPGTPALLMRLHKSFGVMDQGQSFDYAQDLARDGFAISPRLADMIAHDAQKLSGFQRSAAYLLNADGTPKAAGTILKNEAYAQTLDQLRAGGAQWFYGQHAASLTQTIKAHGGHLTLADFAAYEVQERPLLCGPYRTYKVCSMAPSSSGGVALLQALGMLERFDLSAGATAENIHLIAESSRLAFADRNQYLTDPDFMSLDYRALLTPTYLRQRSAMISVDRAQSKVSAGMPDTEGGTAHISIVDGQGNILSMTTTIENSFGSKLMSEGGYFLNNELTDFSFDIDHVNSPASMKRPRSSMAPVIVFDAQGAPVFVVGSAGGSRIIGYILQRLVAQIDWNMPLAQSLAMPNMLARSDIVELEHGAAHMQGALKAKGHEVKVGDMNSGLTAIVIENGTMIGAADPRREGFARGK
jgi:gamma-glutamyltranspeptidase/glutathione hydrolase